MVIIRIYYASYGWYSHAVKTCEEAFDSVSIAYVLYQACSLVHELPVEFGIWLAFSEHDAPRRSLTHHHDQIKDRAWVASVPHGLGDRGHVWAC